LKKQCIIEGFAEMTSAKRGDSGGLRKEKKAKNSLTGL
jgi:hypothetical protein